MGKTLLWLEHVAVMLLLLATLASVIVLIRWAIVRRLAYLFACLPGLIGYGLLTAYMFYWRFDAHAVYFPFYYFSSLSLVYLVGVIVIGWKALRKSPSGRPFAAEWPIGKLALALVVAIVFQTTTFSNLDLAAKECITRLKMEGAAMAQSVAPSRPSAADNAGPLYLQALRALKFEGQEWVKKTKSRPDGGDDFKADDAVIRTYLSAHAADIDLLRRASKLPRCYFEREYGRPSVMILLPETQELRTAVRVLSLDAQVAGSEKDAKRASEDIAAIYGLSRHVMEEPFLISGLVASAFQVWAANTLAEVLGQANFTQEQLALFQIPGDLSMRRSLKRCLIFEEAMLVGGSIEYLADPPSDESSDLFNPVVSMLGGPGGGGGQKSIIDELLLQRLIPLRPQVRPLLPLYRVFVLPDDIYALQLLFQRARQMSVPPTSETIEWFQGSQRAIREMNQDLKTGRCGLMAEIVWPATSTAFEAFQRADTRLDMARVIPAAVRYRLKAGVYPPSVQALVPEYLPAVPPDPFDGTSLKVRADAKRWTVYCAQDSGDNRPLELTLPITATVKK